MPIRNHLSAYKIGVDICHIPRITKILVKPKGVTVQTEDYPEKLGGLYLKFLRRLFRPEELHAFEQKVASLNIRPTPHQSQVLASHVAGR